VLASRNKKAVGPKKLSFITKARRELLNALLESDTIADAADTLGISHTAARQRLFALKYGYEAALKDLKEYRDFKLRMRSKFL